MQYKIVGEPFPAVICTLARGEQMKTEKGSMVWMSPCMSMETTAGGIGKAFGKMFSGESAFQNIYTAQDNGIISFGSSFPGQIIPLQIAPGHEFIVQKAGFLAAEMGVDLSIHFNQKLKGGIFGGEGFIMQRLSGQGTAFIECDGSVVKYNLQHGQSMVVDTGNVLAFAPTVQMAVQRVQGAKNIFLGGEGLYNTVLTGPGEIWLQTMPISNLAAALSGYFTGNTNAGSSSVAGDVIGGLFN